MAGVVDKDGVQWERCSCCSTFKRLDNLGYEPPSAEYEYGRDMCIACTNTVRDIERVQPAKSWLPVYEEA